MTALHLRIAEFKFTHNFVVCNRLSDTEIIFCIGIQKKFSISYAWDKEKNCYIQREGKFLTYTRNCKQKATIAQLNHYLKYHHDTMVLYQLKSPIKIITDDNSTKGRDPNINIINDIHKIKGKNVC